jgi:hypothetical protein
MNSFDAMPQEPLLELIEASRNCLKKAHLNHIELLIEIAVSLSLTKLLDVSWQFLQGPPGTGKSHTLGFATVSRALALATPTRSFRVMVCAKTHAAAAVALASIRARADKTAFNEC